MAKRISQDDREDFRGYCRNCTDSQVLAVFDKEKAANRRVYAQIAREEAIKRGLLPLGEH